MLFSDLRTSVRRIIEDDGLRWDDRVIAQYTTEGVNEIFRKTGGVTDTIPFNLDETTNEYTLEDESPSIYGRITAVRILPENSTTPITLSQVQIEELPVDFTNQEDPTCYALSQVDQAGTLGAFQMIIFNYVPARTTIGSPYGFFVDVSREYDIDTTDATYFNQATGVAETAMLDVDLPILPKLNRPLVDYVVGSMQREVNDANMIQLGNARHQSAVEKFSDMAYGDSLSFYSNAPNRMFP